MKPEYTNSLMLPPDMPGLAVAAAALLGLLAWAAVHRRRRQAGPRAAALHFALRATVGLVGLVATADALQRVLVLATTWPIPLILAAGAAGVEAVLVFYRLECETAGPRAARALPALRVALVLLLTLMLCQPVRVYEASRRIERKVAILVDDSASMRLEERGMTPAEKLRLAESLSVKEAERPHRLDSAARAMERIQQDLAAHADWLASLSPLEPAARAAQFDKKARRLRVRLRATLTDLAAQTNALAAAVADPKLLKPDAPARALVRDTLGRTATDVQARIQDTVAAIDRLYDRDKDTPRPTDTPEKALEALRRAASALPEIVPAIRRAGDDVDTAFHATLPADAQAAIDRCVLRKRSDLARDLLLHHKVTNHEKGTTEPNLLEKLTADYAVRLYTFNDEVHALDAKGLEATYADATNTIHDAGPARRTDLAAAIEKVTRDIPAEQLAGVLLMTDGRHNTPRPVEPFAHNLGLKSIPVNSVIFGGGLRPPPDAGILEVDVPDQVYTNDAIYFSASLKLDGLAGTNAAVSLYCGDSLVATTRVAIAGESLRQKVQLSHQPRTHGLQTYRLTVTAFTNEVTLSNNTFTVPVNVIDDRTRLLLVEDRPRWEFRYLKNLFSGRDSSVAIQHVLFHPDAVGGVPEQPRIAASAARPPSDTEATDLPASEEEWLKFDVVILGDIEPARLNDKALKALRRFVVERGGTLIVIAGARHMPHRFHAGVLAELLPVTVNAEDRPLLPSADPSFRIRLTPEGREHPVLRLATEPAENHKAWDDVPDLYWRHAVKSVKPGASVLAFAVPTSGPDSILARTPNEVPDEATLRRREQFQLANPLLVTHHVARGRVAFIAFDGTWRLRYRVGDTFHHRLWGQLLRWGNGDRLPAGNAFVRFGAARTRYDTDDAVVIKARILKPDYTPVNDASVEAIVYAGERRILRKALRYVPDSAGTYEADIGRFPAGAYRVELKSSAAARILRADGIRSLSAPFSVSAAFPVELAELQGDRGLLSRLASLSGAKVVDPDRLCELGTDLGAPSVTVRERRQHDLWNAGWFLLVLVLLAGTEWLIRKKVSLP